MRFPSGRRCLLVGLPLLLLAVSASGGTPSGFTVDPTSREQSRVLYNTVYQASKNIPSGWAGSVLLNDPGTTTAAFKDATRLRVNYFRAMGGVPSTVVFDDGLSAADQFAALMMSANNALSHVPPLIWLDYTALGASAAGNSNLALGEDNTGAANNGPTAITGYIQDNGGNNPAAGHRRWVLYPPETTMGTGDVETSTLNYAANALYVLDQATFASPAPAARDGFVAWPPPGYVPYDLISPRWSLTYPGADFSAASVTMSRKGNAVPVRLEALTPGAGDNTLVWVPDNEDPTNPPTPTAPAAGKETATTVTVANVLINGAPQSFTYNVTPIDPTVTGGDTVHPVVSGSTTPTVGTAGTYTFNAVPGATGYHWQASGVSALTLDLTAESGPGDVTVTPAGTALVTATGALDGAASYQFASQPPEAMALNAAFVPQSGATLTFLSELEYASTDETASVDISTDGGSTWTSLYAITGAGTSAATESAASTHSVDLSAYAGKTCNLRFRYAYDGSGVYFPRANLTGWYVDDITLTGAQTPSSAPVSGDLTAGQLSFAFTPPAAGDYALQVVPVFFGQYPADSGPVLSVVAAVGGGGTTGGGGGTTGGGGGTTGGGGGTTGGGGGTTTGAAITVAATNPQAHASTGESGVFTLTRTGDLSQKVIVHYAVKGSAVNGSDYTLLTGKVKFKANKSSVTISIVPTSGGTGKVKLVVESGQRLQRRQPGQRGGEDQALTAAQIGAAREPFTAFFVCL